MSIRHRITMLVLLAFAATISVGCFAVLQSHSSASEVKRVTEGVVPSAMASSDLVAQLKDVQVATMSLVYAPDANVAAQAKEQLSASKTALAQSLELQAKQAEGDAQRGLVSQSKESLDNYFAAIDDTAMLKMAGQQAVAEANLFATVAQYQREMGQIVNTLRVEKNRAKDNAIEALNAQLSETVTGIGAVTLLMIVGLSAAGVLLYKQIVRPISGMQAMMSEIADSQDFTRRVPVHREDEIGRSIRAFNAMLAKIEESSSLLRQKTADIQTMLQNMPQGILTVASGNHVHPEYSAFLETIFETKEIAGRNVMDLVFADTNLGADILAQVEAVGGACIGEDVMNFEFNAHLMVGEVEKRMPDGRTKILELDWAPIVDDSNCTTRLLLCIRDATELRKLAAEANEQRRQLEVIGEILGVSQEKFFEFIQSANLLLDDNERLIHAHPEHDTETIAHLFRNMHTVKGNARTYGLRNLTNVVHEAEQTYDELRKRHPGIVWDQRSLLEELTGVKDAVARYAHINEVSLGRKGPGRRANVDRYLLVDRKQIEETLHRLESVNTANLHELLAVRNAVRNTLRLLGTETFSEALAAVFDSLPSLAMELHKVPPVVEIQDNGYVARNQASSLLKNVFMHLVRNSMDHGLETPEERLANGKQAAGAIRLEVGMAEDWLRVTLSDDGRGLALHHIRRLAVERQLIAADAELSDQDIAAQIFRPGFSTAERVTEVSGRGVGMDAVINFIKQENGKVEIRFLDEAEGAEFRRFETVVMLPATMAVHVEDNAWLADEEVAEEDAIRLEDRLPRQTAMAPAA